MVLFSLTVTSLMFFNFSALSTIYILMIPKFTHLQLRPFFQTPKSHIQFPTQHLQLNILWASQTQNVQNCTPLCLQTCPTYSLPHHNRWPHDPSNCPNLRFIMDSFLTYSHIQFMSKSYWFSFVIISSAVTLIQTTIVFHVLVNIWLTSELAG